MNIPVLMRSYMYAYGYQNGLRAKDTVRLALDDAALACETCPACSVACARGFPVRSRLLAIGRIRDVPDEFLDTGTGA